MTYNELAELFKREGGDAQVCFGVISQNQILFGNNDTKKDIISFRNDEPIKWVKETQEEPVSEDSVDVMHKAYMAYPAIYQVGDGKELVKGPDDLNLDYRQAYLKGYYQAKKDFTERLNK